MGPGLTASANWPSSTPTRETWWNDGRTVDSAIGTPSPSTSGQSLLPCAPEPVLPFSLDTRIPTGLQWEA